MGGGANVYRDSLVEERVAAGRDVLLCTYNLPTLDYRVHLFRPGEEARVYRIASFLMLEAILEQPGVDELFLNSPVSFDEPLLFADWLATMRAAHPKLRFTIAVHDYFAVCPSFVLLNADGRYCGIPDVSECAKCLPRHRGSYVALSPPTEIEPWRASWARSLDAADEVRCFSESTRALLLRAHPGLDRARITVIPHRVDFAPPRLPVLDHAAALTIGVIGQISEQKGAGIVRDLLDRIDRAQRDVRVVVIGTLDAAPASRHLHVTGVYHRRDLAGLIETHGVNLCFFPSICPETFSYVIEEMMRLALPIVAFDLGAPGERLRGYRRARLCPDVSGEAALATLIEFHAQLATETMPTESVR
jgi:glycosyltransferase involved in cell wall biosynthesis